MVECCGILLVAFLYFVCDCFTVGIPEDLKTPFAGSATSLSSISLGFYGVLYGYDGW